MHIRQRLISFVLILALALCCPACALAYSGAAITQSQLLAMLVSAYEFLSGQEVNESAITSKLSTDKPVRKALELDIISDYEAAWTHLPATRQSAVARMLATRNALRKHVYGSATDQATVAQARDELGLALKIMGRIDDISAIDELTAGLNGEEKLTRAMYCELLVKAYEALYGPAQTASVAIPGDCDDPYVLKAIDLRLMTYYARSKSFEPDAPVQLRQLADPILLLTNSDPSALIEWTKGEARTAVSELLLSCVGLDTCPGDVQRVLLDVNWDWYVNQLTTGKYSANNCMPACGEMVLNYLNRENKLTTQTLRALSPHNGEGWYDVELYDVLTDNGVELDSVYDMSVQGMMRDIDDGHLLIIMCNFDGASSGHAMVVCGYETYPSGTWFICQDPESPSTNKYGKPSGYLRRVEAQELLMAMKRHVERYFRVMSR